MPKFDVKINFQFYGVIRRAGSTIEVTEEILQQEIDLGKKEIPSKSGKVTVVPMSGLLNHCEAADKETAAMVKGIGKVSEKTEGPDEEQTAARIAEIKELMKEMGKAYRNNWGLAKFEEELKKARIITGE